MNILSKLKVLELCSLQIPFIYIISFNPEDSATLCMIFLFYKWKNWDSVRLTCPKLHIWKVTEPWFVSWSFDKYFICITLHIFTVMVLHLTLFRVSYICTHKWEYYRKYQFWSFSKIVFGIADLACTRLFLVLGPSDDMII